MDRGLLRTELRNELQETIMKREKTPSVKKFTLLYKASRDGCSVEDFQQKCLEKSPTVTVLYGKSGTIFGGFTSEPWTAGSKVVMKDSSAFLFYCHPNKPMKMLEMDPRDFDWAISCYSEWGPTFGGGYFRNFDLQVFTKVDGKKKIEFKNGYFFLNGSVNFNCTYKSRDKGFTSKSINGGGLCVTDVEVYEVCEDMEGGNDKTQRRLKEESAKRSSRKVAVLAKLRNHIQTNVMKRDVFFRLLFQAKKDGCTAEAFHKTCDGRGRTLTIMWGMNNFYGGFTAVNWSSGKRMKKQDKDAFLFCKTIAKNYELIYLTNNKGSQSITCDSNFGPTFGGSLFKGYDFQAFQGNAPPERYEYGYFVANGCVNINNAYSSFEVASSSDFHGGDMTVYDIEVYSVEDEIDDFFNDEVDDCKKRISGYCTGRYGVNTYNILLAGPITAGKTSFCKSVDVAYAERVQNDAGPIANQGESVTNKISRFTIEPKDDCYIRLYDIRGFEDDRDYANELEALLDGKLVESYMFPDEETELSDDNLVDDVNTKPANMIHALCIVLSASTFDFKTLKSIEHLKWILKTAYERDIQVTIIATFMDELCPMVNEDSNRIKKSLLAKDVMERISGTIGVTMDNIFPVINYTTQNDIDDTKSMLALRALSNMVQQADTFVKQSIAKHRVNYVHTLLKFVEERGLNVLCVGKVNAGKSFFIDSVMSTLSENLSNKASGGLLREIDMPSRGTQKFFSHTLSIKDQKKNDHLTNVKFLDMPGFGNDSAINVEQICEVIEGHCPQGYALVNPIDSNAEDYIQTPEWHNKAHVVCFVIDDSSLARPDEEIEMLQSIIIDVLKPKGIPIIIVLTKIDKIGESQQEAIAKVSKSFGVKKGIVHAVKNYVNEKDVMESIDLQILGVLQAIMEEGVKYYRTHPEDSE